MRPDNAKRVVIRVVVLGGAAALVAGWVAAPPVLDAPTIRKAMILMAIGIAAELVSIRIPRGATSEQITLGEVAIAAQVALLPVGLAPVVAVAGLTVSLIVRRRPSVKTAYNAGQYAIATFAAVTCFHGFGGGDMASTAGLAGLFLGMAAFGASNLLTISTIISTTSGERLGNVLRKEAPLSLAITLGSSSIGVVAVALWVERPVLVFAILAPVLTLHLAYRGWIQQREFVVQIADEKAKLERIIEHSREGIALVDAEGTVVLWSPSMTKLTGVPAAEAEGKSIGFLLSGRAPDGTSAQVEVDGEDSLMEVTRADGSTLWLRVRHGAALDPSGTVRWDVVLVHDVTAERETEKMKKHFLATVSHELRTPLTPIIGFAKFLLRRDDMPESARREALTSVVDRAEHMQRLVEDLLLASSMDEVDARPPHARREPVDLAEVVGPVVRSAKTSHPEREIVVEEREPVLAVGDRLRLTQVTANLLSNAVKYSAPDTTVRVVIGREGDRAVLTVIDDGRGIPSDRFEEIFRKFRRLEDPDRMETGGAGLGLFIVDQLVRAMAGVVEVSSRVGRGSTFTVRLPALDTARVEGDDERPALAG